MSLHPTSHATRSHAEVPLDIDPCRDDEVDALKKSITVVPPVRKWNWATVASLLSYSVCQVVMIIVNKTLVTSYGFKEISFLLFMQNTGLCIWLMVLWCCGFRWNVTLRMFLASVPLCLLYICYLSTGLRALDQLSVPIYTLMKNSCPVFIAVAENVVNSTQHADLVIFSLFIILFGVTIGQDGTSWASSYGLLWMLLHMYFNVFYVVYTKEFVVRCAPTNLESLVCSCAVSIPLYVLMITCFTEWDSSFHQIRALYSLHGGTFVMTFFTSMTMGACLTFSIFWICQQTSALTLAVVGSFNKVPIVITSLIVFSGSTLSLRNGVGLGIVLAGSLCYAHGSYCHPPHRVATRWTRKNVAIMCLICLFIAFSLTGAFPALSCASGLPKELAAHFEAPSGEPSPAQKPLWADQRGATLVVLYPGNSPASVADFVSTYLPQLQAVVKQAPGWRRHHFPHKHDPLRVNTASPILLLRKDSPLLQPELLPFLGSVFSEVLVDESSADGTLESPGRLLRVVKYPHWNTVGAGSNPPDEPARKEARAWNVLALTNAIPVPETPFSMHYIAVDATTALCSPLAPHELFELSGRLCFSGANRTLAGERPSGAAVVGDLTILDAAAPALLLLVRKMGHWENAGWAEPAEAGVAMARTTHCAARLDPSGRWPWGLRPHVAATPWNATRVAANDSIPAAAAHWLSSEARSEVSRNVGVATCPRGTLYDDVVLAEAAAVQRKPDPRRAQRACLASASFSSSLYFFTFIAAASVGVSVLCIVRGKSCYT
ncbi:GDP-mannose transporter [Diplonema papillatum]|nr:GDP-mannose transporter [Diplonema papillatum]